MPFYAETLGLPDNAFFLLRDLIHQHTGLFYDDGKRELLADKLSPLVVERGFNSFIDYYYFLKYDAAALHEWQEIFEALSVQETYFWREVDQIKTLVNVLMPQQFAPQGKTLRIWSAACATGEEPLTIAMALDEAGWFNRLRIEINATDASRSAIEKARQGVYRERSFRALPEPLQERYFTKEAAGFRVAPHIHERVSWAQANIMRESDVALYATAPVIFCRNLFIYFSPESVGRTISRFHHYMPAPGYLFVAASESLLRLTVDFRLDEIGGSFVYVKD
jgi:chemotaxis protein methyltransferase CheR